MDSTTGAAGPASAIAQPQGGGAAHILEVLTSEWCKLRTARSTWWALAAVTVFNVVTAAVLGMVLPKALSASQQADVKNPIGLSLGGLHLSQAANEMAVRVQARLVLSRASPGSVSSISSAGVISAW